MNTNLFKFLPIYFSRIYLFVPTMSKANIGRNAMEKRTSVKESQKLNHGFFTKHLKKVYPIGLQKSSSSSSLSSSLSENSNDSSLTDSLTLLDENISLGLHLISPRQREEHAVANAVQQQPSPQNSKPGEVKRCNWITKNCGMIKFISSIIILKIWFHFLFICIEIMTPAKFENQS